MRRGILLFALGLAGCGQAETTPQQAAKQAVAAADESSEDKIKAIPCALGGAAAFKRECTVEEVIEGQQITWIVRHPGGGFRRFAMIDGGTRIATADGADEVELTRDGAEFIVAAGPDRYRFPAASPNPSSAPAK